MPRVNEYQGIQFLGFDDGLNNHVDASRLETNELSQALNIRLGARGEMQLRTGYVREDNGTLQGNGRFLYPWRGPGGTDHLIVVDGSGDIWHGPRGVNTFYDAGKNAEAGPGLDGYTIGFAGAKGFLYVSGKHSGAVKRFDGSIGGWVSISTIPDAKMLHYRHNRLFAINDLARPSGIYYSALGDAEDFPVDNYIEVIPEDGYELNASAIFGDDLILFKDRAFWKLSGRTPSSFSLYRIDNHRGTVAGRGVAQMRGQLAFYDRDSGIWTFDGANLELLSQPINDYMLEGQDYDEAYKVSMYTDQDRLYCSVPWAAGGLRTFVYFANTGGWTEYGTGFEGATEYLDVRMLGLSGAEGVYRADKTATTVPPSTDDIVATVRTGWQLLGGPGAKARVRRLEMNVKANTGTTGIVRMYRDYDDTTPYITHTFDPGDIVWPLSVSSEERRIAIDGWGNRVHAVMFEFEFSEPPFQINEFTVFYTGGIDVRGER